MKSSRFITDYQEAAVRPSPDYDERRGKGGIILLIMHYTGMECVKAAECHLETPESMVSARYVVHEDGTVVRMVAEEKRAWHAGESIWQGETDMNFRSIGVEVANPGLSGGFPYFPEQQVAGLIALFLSKDILARHDIRPRHVLGPSDIAPGRRIDPGEKFPWGRLAAAGIGCYVEPAVIAGRSQCMLSGASGRPVAAFQSMPAFYGYGVAITGIFDEGTESVTRASQRHFRPERGGAELPMRQRFSPCISCRQALLRDGMICFSGGFLSLMFLCCIGQVLLFL